MNTPAFEIHQWTAAEASLLIECARESGPNPFEILRNFIYTTGKDPTWSEILNLWGPLITRILAGEDILNVPPQTQFETRPSASA